MKNIVKKIMERNRLKTIVKYIAFLIVLLALYTLYRLVLPLQGNWRLVIWPIKGLTILTSILMVRAYIKDGS